MSMRDWVIIIVLNFVASELAQRDFNQVQYCGMFMKSDMSRRALSFVVFQSSVFAGILGNG